MQKNDSGITEQHFYPFIKGLVNSAGAYGAALSFGYTTSQSGGAGFGRGIIHLIEDNGHFIIWSFEHNGDFVSSGDVKTGSRSLNKTHQDDFNFVSVKQAGNLGGLHINRQDGKSARLELNGYRFKIWVEGKYDILFPERGGTLALTSEVVSDIRLGSAIYRHTVDSIPGGGYVLTGIRVQGGVETLEYKPIQKLVNGNWYTISG